MNEEQNPNTFSVINGNTSRGVSTNEDITDVVIKGEKPIKYALCVDKAIMESQPDINLWATKLVDRAICETDESLLQIIPYIVLHDPVTYTFLSYTRGVKGEESRLHNKISIGIGGHIEEEVKETIGDTIIEAAVREIFEETGCLVDPDIISQSTVKGSVSIIYTPIEEDPVSKYHIAVVLIIPVDPAECTKLEEGVIIDPKWLTYFDIRTLIENKDTSDKKLETWSYFVGKAIVDRLTF